MKGDWAGLGSLDPFIIFSLKPIDGTSTIFQGGAPFLWTGDDEIHWFVGEILGIHDGHHELDSQNTTTNGG